MSTSQAKKMFYDWLDRNRPFANHKNMYDAMELVVEQAAHIFHGAPLKRIEYQAELEVAMLELTKGLPNHPEVLSDKLPCGCQECCSE